MLSLKDPLKARGTKRLQKFSIKSFYNIYIEYSTEELYDCKSFQSKVARLYIRLQQRSCETSQEKFNIRFAPLTIQFKHLKSLKNSNYVKFDRITSSQVFLFWRRATQKNPNLSLSALRTQNPELIMFAVMVAFSLRSLGTGNGSKRITTFRGLVLVCFYWY